jgi:hypothetical protein
MNMTGAKTALSAAAVTAVFMLVFACPAFAQTGPEKSVSWSPTKAWLPK